MTTGVRLGFSEAALGQRESLFTGTCLLVGGVESRLQGCLMHGCLDTCSFQPVYVLDQFIMSLFQSIMNPLQLIVFRLKVSLCTICSFSCFSSC